MRHYRRGLVVIIVGCMLFPFDGNAQILGKAAKVMTKKAAKEVSEYVVKDAVKEGGQRLVKSGAKNLTKEVAEEAAETASKKVVKNVGREGFEKILKEGTSSVAQSASKREVGEAVAANTTKTIAEKLGGKEAVSASSKSTQTAMKTYAEKKIAKEAADKVGTKVGREVLENNKTLAKHVDDICYRYNVKPDDLEIIKKGDGAFDISWNRVKGESPVSSIQVRGNEVYAKGGSYTTSAGKQVGEVNQYLNHPMPNTKYHLDDASTYVTDAAGRVDEVSADLGKLRDNMAANNWTRNGQRNSDVQNMVINDLDGIAKKGANGKRLDDGSHLIPRNAGGANERLNQVPWNAYDQEHGAWKQVELEIEKHLKAGSDVKTHVKLKYDGASKRPTGAIYEYWVDGKHYIQNLVNPIE